MTSRGGDNGALLSICLTMLIDGALYFLVLDMKRLPDPDWVEVMWFAIAVALTLFIRRFLFHSIVHDLGAIRSASVGGPCLYLRWFWTPSGWVKHCSRQWRRRCCLFFLTSYCRLLNRDAKRAVPAPLMPPKSAPVQEAYAG